MLYGGKCEFAREHMSYYTIGYAHRYEIIVDQALPRFTEFINIMWRKYGNNHLCSSGRFSTDME